MSAVRGEVIGVIYPGYMEVLGGKNGTNAIQYCDVRFLKVAGN